MKRIGSTAAYVVALMCSLCAISLIWFSNDRFLLSGGSDAPNLILAPPLGAQVIAGILLLALALLGIRLRGASRVGVLVLWCAVLALATHRLVVDSASGEIRDVWGLIALQRLPLQDDESLPNLVRRDGLGFIVLGPPSGGRSLIFFEGPWPFAVDTHTLRRP